MKNPYEGGHHLQFHSNTASSASSMVNGSHIPKAEASIHSLARFDRENEETDFKLRVQVL